MSNLLTHFIAANGNEPIDDWHDNILRFANIMHLSINQRLMQPSERHLWDGKPIFQAQYDVHGNVVRVIMLGYDDEAVTTGRTWITEILGEFNSTDFIVEDIADEPAELSIVEKIAVGQHHLVQSHIFLTTDDPNIIVSEDLVFSKLARVARELPMSESDQRICNGRVFLYGGREIVVAVTAGKMATGGYSDTDKYAINLSVVMPDNIAEHHAEALVKEMAAELKELIKTDIENAMKIFQDMTPIWPVEKKKTWWQRLFGGK